MTGKSEVPVFNGTRVRGARVPPLPADAFRTAVGRGETQRPVFPGERRCVLSADIVPPHVVTAVLSKLIEQADIVTTAHGKVLLCPVDESLIDVLAVFDDPDGWDPDPDFEPDVDDEPDHDNADWRGR